MINYCTWRDIPKWASHCADTCSASWWIDPYGIMTAYGTQPLVCDLFLSSSAVMSQYYYVDHVGTGKFDQDFIWLLHLLLNHRAHSKGIFWTYTKLLRIDSSWWRCNRFMLLVCKIGWERSSLDYMSGQHTFFFFLCLTLMAVHAVYTWTF